MVCTKACVTLPPRRLSRSTSSVRAPARAAPSAAAKPAGPPPTTATSKHSGALMRRP